MYILDNTHDSHAEQEPSVKNTPSHFQQQAYHPTQTFACFVPCNTAVHSFSCIPTGNEHFRDPICTTLKQDHVTTRPCTYKTHQPIVYCNNKRPVKQILTTCPKQKCAPPVHDDIPCYVSECNDQFSQYSEEFIHFEQETTPPPPPPPSPDEDVDDGFVDNEEDYVPEEEEDVEDVGTMEGLETCAESSCCRQQNEIDIPSPRYALNKCKHDCDTSTMIHDIAHVSSYNTLGQCPCRMCNKPFYNDLSIPCYNCDHSLPWKCYLSYNFGQDGPNFAHPKKRHKKKKHKPSTRASPSKQHENRTVEKNPSLLNAFTSPRGTSSSQKLLQKSIPDIWTDDPFLK